jgi:hypothetical protein
MKTQKYIDRWNAQCHDCDFNIESNEREINNKTRNHAKKTGHKICLEIVYNKWYNFDRVKK